MVPLSLRVNGQKQEISTEKGFVSIRRTWKSGDIIELGPMPVRQVVSHENVESNRNQVALCVVRWSTALEGIDNEKVLQMEIPEDANLRVSEWHDVLGGIQVIHGKALVLGMMMHPAWIRLISPRFLIMPGIIAAKAR